MIKFQSKIRVFFLLTLLSSCHTYSKANEHLPPLPPCEPINKPVTVALVLGGGGARGLAHVGVLEVLEQEGIEIDCIIGCSAGSIVGALYAERPEAKWVYEALINVKRNDIIRINLLDARMGFSQGSGLRLLLEKNLQNCTFSDLKIPLRVAATDLESGALLKLGGGEVIPAVHASCAIPCIFKPVPYYGRMLVDGGIANPIPVALAKEEGAKVIIAVDLCFDLEEDEPSHLFGVATRSAQISYIQLSKHCQDGADIIIRPKVGHLGLFDDSCNRMIYDAGVEAAKDALPKIRACLARIQGL
jgi:NTE family protein